MNSEMAVWQVQELMLFLRGNLKEVTLAIRY